MHEGGSNHQSAGLDSKPGLVMLKMLFVEVPKHYENTARNSDWLVWSVMGMARMPGLVA